MMGNKYKMKLSPIFSNILQNKLMYLYVFITLRFMDLLLTNITITYMGAYEANPIAAWVLDNYSWHGITLVIVLICVWTMFNVKIIPQHIWNKASPIFWLICAITAIGPYYNIRIILYKLGATNTW